MSEAVVVAMIAALPGLIGVAVGFWVSLRKIREVHVSLNSRLTQLIASTAAASRAEGVVAGREETKDLIVTVKDEITPKEQP